MFDLIVIFSIFFAVIELIKEKIEPVAHKDTRFDWCVYWEDVENGIGAMDQVKKVENGSYYTTSPIPHKQEVIEGVVDIKRYQHDKEVYGEAFTEINRKNGAYKYMVGC